MKASNYTYENVRCWKKTSFALIDNIGKSMGERMFEIVHCLFEGQADMYYKIQPDWLNRTCELVDQKANLQFQKEPIFL